MIRSEEKIIDVIDEEKGVVIKTETQEIRIPWSAAFVLHELGFSPLRRKELYESLRFNEGAIDYAIEKLLNLRLIKKDKEGQYTLTTAGKNVWEKL